MNRKEHKKEVKCHLSSDHFFFLWDKIIITGNADEKIKMNTGGELWKMKK
jgi:hypothetical protein